MRWKNTKLKTRLNLIASIILLFGFGSALLVYQAADHDYDGVSGYEVPGGYAYPFRPEDSKMYRHDLELYGGKANLLVNEFSRWFNGLWHGKQLAFTIACLTAVVSSGLFLVAGRLPSDLKSDGRDEDNHTGIE